MSVRDLVRPAPLLGPTATVADALRVLAGHDLPGVVLDQPHAAYGEQRLRVVPASQVLACALPPYVLDDPALGRLVEDVASRAAADPLPRALARIDHPPASAPPIDVDAGLVEAAASMAEHRTPLLAVVDDSGAYLGVVTADRVAAALLP